MTKILVPRRREGTVARRRLLDTLHRGLDHRVQLVVAPAGYGKTTLLVEFAHEARTAGVPACWLALDEHSGDARSFFEHLILSVRQHFPTFGKRTSALLRNVGDAARQRETIVTTLCNELAAKAQDFFLLVVDDFHLVHGSAAVNQAVDQLIHQLPSGVHIILASRMIPTQLNLVGLASRLELTGIGVADMRFRPAEAAELIRRHARSSVPEREVSHLVERAEGWVTAILLSLHGGRDGVWPGIPVGDAPRSEPTYAYMATQVFDHLPHDLQQFLLESAVLEALSPEECDAVLGRTGSASLLGDLTRRGLFVEPLETGAGSGAGGAVGDRGAPISGGGENPNGTEDHRVILPAGAVGTRRRTAQTRTTEAPSAPQWLRYHGLWREYLLARLRSENPRRLVALRRRAAQRALSRGDSAAAVEHLSLAGDSAHIARTLLTIADSEVAAGHAQRLLAWISELPESAVKRRPRLLLHAARALRRLDRLSEALETLARCEGFATPLREWDTVYLSRASRAVLLTLVGRPDEAVSLVTDLIDQLNRHPRSPLLRVHVEKEACQALGIAGRNREAISHGAAALADLDAVQPRRDRLLVAATIKHTLGICEDRLGNSAAATAWLAEAQDHWRALGDDVNQLRVLNQTGQMHQRAGQLDEAAAAFRKALALAERTGHLSTHTAILNNLARCERERGNLSRALEAAEEAISLARQGQESALLGEALLETSLLWLRLGRATEAVPLLDEGFRLAEDRWRPGLPLAGALRALAYARAGRRTAARQDTAAAAQALEVLTPPEPRLRALVALAAAAAAEGQEPRAVSLLQRARRWARDRSMLPMFFGEGVQYRETAQLVLAGKRFPPEILPALRDAVDTNAAVRPGTAEGESDAREPTPAAFEIRLFDMPALLRDGVDVVVWRTRLVRELLCFLALRTDRLVRTEVIADALLPDAESERGLTSVRHAMYHLRRLFAPLDPVQTVRGGYRLVRDPAVRCDLTEFELLLSQADAAESRAEAGTESAEQRRSLEGAVALYRGPLLDGMAGEWTEARRASAESQVLAALEKLLALHERAGRHEDASTVARRALELDPFLERFHVALIRSLVARGQTSAAVAHFRTYHRTMREELGRDVHPEAVRLLARLVPSLLPEHA